MKGLGNFFQFISFKYNALTAWVWVFILSSFSLTANANDKFSVIAKRAVTEIRETLGAFFWLLPIIGFTMFILALISFNSAKKNNTDKSWQPWAMALGILVALGSIIFGALTGSVGDVNVASEWDFTDMDTN